jgi:hypothetical protein
MEHMDAPHALYVLLCLSFHDGTVVCEDPITEKVVEEQQAELKKQDWFYDPDSSPFKITGSRSLIPL